MKWPIIFARDKSFWVNPPIDCAVIYVPALLAPVLELILDLTGEDNPYPGSYIDFLTVTSFDFFQLFLA